MAVSARLLHGFSDIVLWPQAIVFDGEGVAYDAIMSGKVWRRQLSTAHWIHHMS